MVTAHESRFNPRSSAATVTVLEAGVITTVRLNTRHCATTARCLPTFRDREPGPLLEWHTRTTRVFTLTPRHRARVAIPCFPTFTSKRQPVGRPKCTCPSSCAGHHCDRSTATFASIYAYMGFIVPLVGTTRCCVCQTHRTFCGLPHVCRRELSSVMGRFYKAALDSIAPPQRGPSMR